MHAIGIVYSVSLAACAIHTAYNKEKNKNVGEKSMRQTFAPNEKKSGQMKFFCAFGAFGAGQREPWNDWWLYKGSLLWSTLHFGFKDNSIHTHV